MEAETKMVLRLCLENGTLRKGSLTPKLFAFEEIEQPVSLPKRGCPENQIETPVLYVLIIVP